MLTAEEIFITVVNARFAKPIDEDMVTTALTRGGPVITAEEHSLDGGFGSAVLETANRLGLSTESIIRLGLDPERFYEHGSRAHPVGRGGSRCSEHRRHDATRHPCRPPLRTSPDAGRADFSAQR